MSSSVWMGDLHLDEAQILHTGLRIASGLKHLGVVAEESVALLMRNDLPFLPIVVGIEKLGGIPTPINWHFSPAEMSHVIRDCGARALFAHADLWRAVRDDLDPRALEQLTVILVEPSAPVREAYGLDPAACRVAAPEFELYAWAERHDPVPDEPKPATAGMIYTSGTTGKPKGVRRMAPIPVKPGGNHDAFVPWMRCLLAPPIYHSAPYRQATSTFAVGGELYLMAKFDPEAFLKTIAERQITHAFTVPTMFIRLLRLPEEVRNRYDISSLRHVVHAGAPCPPDVKQRMIDWFGPVIYEFYGGTETGAVTYCTSDEYLAHPGTVGRALPDAVIKALDENGLELPPMTPGDIYCRQMSYPDFTYLNRPEARAEMEVDGLFGLGDVGYLDADGYLFLTDRKRDMVISGGSNIYCNMIEATLLESPKIADCAAFGIPDEELGEALAVAVQAEEGESLTEQEVHDFAKGRLKGYMAPRIVIIVEALPRDPSGKIFKRQLRDPYWEGRTRRI